MHSHSDQQQSSGSHENNLQPQSGLVDANPGGGQCLLACQVVLGSMAQRLASWVLRDGSLTAADAVHSQLLSTSVAVLPPVNHAHQMHIGTCALGKVMV